jgi:hypothetical protein
VLDHVIKVLERVIQKRVRSQVSVNDIQLVLGHEGELYTCNIYCEADQKKRFLEKKRDSWMAFFTGYRGR